MHKFISSFPVGFGKVIENILPLHLKDVKIINVFDELVYFEYKNDIRHINNLFFLNNTFLVIKEFYGSKLQFKDMVYKTEKIKLTNQLTGKTFRVRFSRENQFEKVDKQIVSRVETFILKQSRLRTDRLNPDTEFWYMIRSENIGFFCQLLKKRVFTEKNLNKGELRPELAFLLCAFADINKEDLICDPFAGFGSIPIQAHKHFSFEHFFASDINMENMNQLSKKLQSNKVSVMCSDVVNLKNIYTQLVDKIITDPPWGFYEEISNMVLFYQKMFNSFRKCLKENGMMIILSARKQELEEAAKLSNASAIDKINILVNGKKASVYKLQFKK